MCVSCCKCTTVRFPCAIGVSVGILLLVAGSCVILIWAFVPKFSQTYPIGLQVGAVTCGLGVLVVIAAVIAIYRWHFKLSRNATRDASAHKLSNAREFYIATPSSFSFAGNEFDPGLKKAHSTAYISLGPSQAEKIKVLGLVHGFISATDLRRPPLLASVSLKSSAHSQSNGVFRNLSIAEPTNPSTVLVSTNPDFLHCPKRFIREKSIRRSLPRVLVHPPVRRPIHESHSQTNLTETSNERMQLGDGVDENRSSRSNGREPSTARKSDTDQPNLTDAIEPDAHVPHKGHLSSEPKYSVSSRHSTREVNFSQLDADTKPRCRLTRVLTTPPIGRASLFNLNASEHVSPSVWTCTSGNPLTTGSNFGSKTEHDSRASLDRANSGKRFLLMSQSGQVISCTTLFGEVDEADTSSTGGVGCRRLQPCPGWNFFPVFVGRDQFLSDEELEKQANTNASANHNSVTNAYSTHHTSDAGLSFTTSEVEFGYTHADNSTRPVSRLPDTGRALWAWKWLRRMFRRARPIGRGRYNRVKATGERVPTSDVEAGLQESLISTTAPLASGDSEPKGTASVRLDTAKEEFTVDDDSTTDLRASNATNALNNASVFSLPAISPDLWTADRPVWIMGVPVPDNEATDGGRWLATMDACDVILLREKQADPPVTGSTSSVYAFHVKPPARLGPTANSRRQPRSHGRARSLGRILFSDKVNTTNKS